MLDQFLVALPLVIGAYITLSLLKLPDFSIESAYLFGAVMAYLAKDLPVPYVLLSASLGGIFVGAMACFLNQYLRIPFLLTGIILNGLFHGVTQYLLGTSVQSFHLSMPLSESLLFGFIGLVLTGLMAFIFRSKLGLAVAIYGNNPRFFQHHQISGRYVMFFAVMLGHGCAGIGGFLFALSNGLVDLTMNFGILLLCLMALILGKSFIRIRQPSIFVPILGLLVYFCIQQALIRAGLELKYFNAFQALFILGALCLLYRKEKVSMDQLGV